MLIASISRFDMSFAHAQWVGLSIPLSSTTNRIINTKLAITRRPNCLYDLWLKFDSCNSLLSSVHTLLVNILECFRLYTKQNYYYYIMITSITRFGFALGVKPCAF